MSERRATTPENDEFKYASYRRALHHVREAYRKEHEAAEVARMALHTDDLADEGWMVHHAEDNLFNFLQHWGLEQATRDLRALERRALYERAAPLDDEELNHLFLCREMTDNVEALHRAHQSIANAKGESRKRQTAVADAVLEAEGAMLKFFDHWMLEEVLEGMRTVQRRATLWCEMPMTEEDMPSYLFLDELICRMKHLCEMEATHGHLRKNYRRRRRAEHSVLTQN